MAGAADERTATRSPVRSSGRLLRLGLILAAALAAWGGAVWAIEFVIRANQATPG